MIVIASIHQPSTATFNLFDKLLLLSEGKTCYFGSVEGVQAYFTNAGFPIPPQTNPAEYLLDLANVDFAQGQEETSARLESVHTAWIESEYAQKLLSQVQNGQVADKFVYADDPLMSSHRGFMNVLVTLIHRSFIKSYRDVVVYGIRAAMYIGKLSHKPLLSDLADLLCPGLAIMMGTVWLRLHTDQQSIQPFINAIVTTFDLSSSTLES